MRKGMGILLFLLVAAAGSLVAQAPPVVPMTQKELVDLLKGKVAPERVAALLTERGVDFELTPDIEKKLRKAKADDQLIEAVRQEGPTARAARLAQGGRAGGARVTPEEGQVFLTVQNELDPDRKLQMVKDFETKYPSSALLTDMYAMAALAGLDKNDAQLAVDYAEKSLKLNGDNLRSLLIMAYMLPQPQLLRGGDFDKDKKLSDAEIYAKHALELVERLTKLPNETDEQLKERKAQLAMQAHSDLGMVHLQRSAMSLAGPDREELAKAQQEYEMAVSLTTTPTPQDYFRLGETLAIQNKVDEAIQAFTKASELSQGTVLKTYADQRIEGLKKRVEQQQAPAKP